MADAEQSIPDIYREAAEEVRQLARRARLTDIRGDLLELSARFERLAAYADAAIRLGAPGYPHGERLPAADDRSDRTRAADRPLSSGSGPHSESATLASPHQTVIEAIENAPAGPHTRPVSHNRYSHRAGFRAKRPRKLPMAARAPRSSVAQAPQCAL